MRSTKCPFLQVPASASFPLFGVGQANPLGRHGADVVVSVEIGLLNLSSIYHKNDIIYGDAERTGGEISQERKEKN